MQLFNSLTKAIEKFQPLDDKKIIAYVCGLTPYDSAHIGHARTYVSFDVLKRYFIKKGYTVYHIQNITDVEDKIINRCKETGTDPMKLTTAMHDDALELFDSLNILRADIYPKVTEHINEILDLVQLLLERKYAYETESGVYFDVLKFPDYGKLSGQDIEHMKAGVRKEVAEGKKSPLDFALWKKTKGEILEFDSPWGTGRPGWHIECSAMAKKYAKRTLDIHCGARDLIFPHHENEIAQSEAANGQKFCNYWVHTGFLTVNGEKMSKSIGNFITLSQALSQFNPNALRLFYLQAHYRSPLDYDEEKLSAAEESVERIFNALGLMRELSQAGQEPKTKPDSDFRKSSDELVKSFYAHLENDLNTPEALGSLFSLVRLTNSHASSANPDTEQLKKLSSDMEAMLWILGLKEKKRGISEGLAEKIFSLATELGIKEKPKTTENAMELIIKKRNEARQNKDYKTSDLIRDRLKEIGIILEDKEGVTKYKIV
ncbi:cysteine--tRNA ligase [Candidatus Micrarchaeota archaeon]|nr:cysteine--tRNA ligase [Candidatus Micrarchaeota archaeon]MBU1165616.1 cysteine--tRNA ligase [Candidatus Micrarchaeota archaeon]MBU1886445.1 cysteine--tRNA ligase [Candidatus Micrarchaeota archaeon]